MPLSIWSLLLCLAYDASSAQSGLQVLLDQHTKQFDHKRVVFNVTRYYGIGCDLPSGEPEQRYFVSAEKCATVWCDPQYRFEVTTVRTCDSLAFMKGWKQVFGWDGYCAFSTTFTPDNRNVTRLERVPPVDHYASDFLTWQGWWVFQNPEPQTMLQLFRNAVLNEGAMTDQFTFITFVGVDSTTRLELRGCNGISGPELSSVTASMYVVGTPRDPSAPPDVIHSITFDPVEQAGGTGISPGATIKIMHNRKDAAERFWYWVRIELDNMAPIDRDDQLFLPELLHDMQIEDTRYRIGYKIGDNKINFDGRLLEAAAPVRADISGTLCRVVKEGALGPVVDIVRGPLNESSYHKRSWRSYAKYGLLCAIVLIALMVVVRRGFAKRLVVSVGLFFVITLLPSCKDKLAGTRSGTEGRVFDIGQVSLVHGPRTVEHTFTIVNETSATMNIATVKPTCACVKAVVSGRSLAPGGSVDLQLQVEIKNLGQATQGASVVFDDNSVVTYTLTAFGTTNRELTPILRGPKADNKSKVRIDFVYVCTDAGPISSNPKLISPPGVDLAFEKWETIENHDLFPLRPTWQLGTGVLDIGNYDGEFPIDLKFETDSGAMGKVRIVHMAET